MRHINKKDDWFYELKPLFIIALGLIGVSAKGLFGLPMSYGLISFAFALILLGAGGYILKARKEYRKKSIMTM